jgi:curved DNA-binding protein CbpA
VSRGANVIGKVPKSHYQVLGVEPEASVEEIERAFRGIARHVHPDLHGGDGAAVERMKELNVIRETLTDPARRAAYDGELRAQRAAAAPARPTTLASAPRRVVVPTSWKPERGAAWLNPDAFNARAGAPTAGAAKTPSTQQWRAPVSASRWAALQAGLARVFGRGTSEEERSALGAVLAPVFVVLCFALGLGVIWLFFFLRRLSS